MSDQFHYKDSRGVSNLVSDTADPHQILAQEIGPAYTAYRQRWEAARTFQEQPPFPLHVDYELMFRCNLRCPICLMSLPSNKRTAYGDPNAELSEDTVKRLIDEGSQNGQCAIGFGGLWEPLLSPALPRLVAHARKKGMVDALFNTNAFFLTPDKARELIDAGLTKLMISLDAATEATYQQMRPGSDFQTVCQNIENFLELRRRLNSRLPLLRLSFCRTALNEHELTPFITRWQGLTDFFSIQTYGQYATESPPNFPKNNITPPPVGHCAQPQKRLTIRHNGDIIPCCDASGLPLVIGNIYKETLAEAWQNQKMATLRTQLAANSLPAPCQACQNKFSPQQGDSMY